MTVLVFVYGSLKRGFENSPYLDHASLLIADATSPAEFNMISLGAYPGLVLGHDQVQGEIYEVDRKTLDLVDRLECNGNFYVRRQFAFPQVEDLVWVYLLIPEYAQSFKVPDDPRVGRDSLGRQYWKSSEQT